MPRAISNYDKSSACVVDTRPCVDAMSTLQGHIDAFLTTNVICNIGLQHFRIELSQDHLRLGHANHITQTQNQALH